MAQRRPNHRPEENGNERRHQALLIFQMKPSRLPRKPRKISRKKRKVSKISLWRAWNVPDWAYHRYEGLKGVYWYWFSRTVRDRDYEKYGGICMTCDGYVEEGSDQAGHLFAARNCGFALLFHPLNVHLQHSKCNNPRFTPSAGV